MTNTPQKPPPGNADREAKLAQALRANLRPQGRAEGFGQADGQDMTTHLAKTARLAPKPYKIFRRLRATTPPQGEPFDVIVEISDAFPIEDTHDWACALRIVGLDREHQAEDGRAFFGVDPMQAIEHALFLAHAELELAIEKYGLEWADGGPYTPATLFRRPGEAGHQA